MGGHGSNLKKLKELASKLGIEDNVYFVGMLSREKIIEYYNKSDVFILSSNFESFGVVIIEALSQGLPVISTICGGPESLIDNENGILVSKDCVEEMVLAMKSMKKNYNQYDRVEIRNKTLNEYGENNITSILIKLYREVVKH
ncbi:glycosyltransferase [Thiospirochaeta perfilievii]|uniref:glycosyltransferase n=1 Tax=Thiospirochaeta perfilievii TaxID=252967 RepID=UPI001FED89BB|nr:glycosyltransferase [Thiospirochaeta perfilievii]